MDKKIFSVVSLVVLAVVSSSCSKRFQDLPVFSPLPLRDVENESVGRFKTSYLADQIHAYFRGNISGPIAVTTFVDLDNLYETSTFGRVLSEMLLSEMSMKGYNVVEVRLGEAMQIMHNKGEFILSRDTANLRSDQNLSAIIVGTYVVSPERVYLNTRVIDPASARLISVGSVEMEKTEEIAKLVRTNITAQSMERIPVRHLGYGRVPALHYYPYNSGSTWAPAGAMGGDNMTQMPYPQVAADTKQLVGPAPVVESAVPMAESK
jgi:TolB-like protein